MKSKIAEFLLVIVTIILLGVIVFIGFLIYANLEDDNISLMAHSSNVTVSVEDGNDVTVTKKEKSIKNILEEIFYSSDAEKISYSAQASSGKFYYEQLNETQKILYNGLQENKDYLPSGTYIIKYGDIFNNILERDGGIETLQSDYQSAIEAFTHDNPDLFYLNVGKLYLNIETIKKLWNTTYNVYIAPKEGTTYFEDQYTTEAQVRNALIQIEQIRDYVLSKLKNNTYKNIKIIHDYLVNNIEYDQTYSKPWTYNIYGALVEKECVCDGYARAFKYLANSAGIDCELVQGIATNSSGKTEAHAWNAVMIENKWYYVDVTWDDPIVIGNGYLLDSYHYKYFLKGARSFLKDHTEKGQFTSNGKIFVYPNVSNTDY